MTLQTMLTLRTHTGQEVLYPKPKSAPKFNETTGPGVSWAGWSWGPITGCLHGCDYCVSPDTPVLMADMNWRAVKDVAVGDRVIAFDEESPRGVERRWRTAEITAKWATKQIAYRIALADGREVVASGTHKWLCSRNTWRTTDELRPGHRIRTVYPATDLFDGRDYEAGYIAGVTLGDGTFRWEPGWRSDKLGFPQAYWRVAVLRSDRAVLDRLTAYLASVDIEVEVRPFAHGGHGVMAKVETRRLQNLAALSDLCQERDSDAWWAGWLAGLFDTDGSISGGSLRIHQKDTQVLDAAVAAGARLGFKLSVETFARSCSTARLIGDVVELARFASTIRPALTRKIVRLDDRKVRTDLVEIASVAVPIEVDMVDITTTARTFVANGLLTHNCYAREISTSGRFASAFPAGFTPLFHPERLDAPKHTRIPKKHLDNPAYRRVFVCSVADMYGRWVPQDWIDQVHAAMTSNPFWQYITLTKFPTRYLGLGMPPGAWVGTSVDTQRRVRIAEDAFRQIDGAAVRWLSLEPLLEPLEFTDLSIFDWVVIGAQTATNQPNGRVEAYAPPFEWVARIVAQAREAGCRVHLKPNLLGKAGPKSPGMQLPDEYPEWTDGAA